MSALDRPAQHLNLKPVKHRVPRTLGEYSIKLQNPKYRQELVKFEQIKRLPKLLPAEHRNIARAIRYELLRSPSENIVMSMGRNIYHPQVWVSLAGLGKK